MEESKAQKNLRILHRAELIRNLAAANQGNPDEGEDLTSHTRFLEEIRQLQLDVETVAEKTMRIRNQKLENLCIRVALELGWLQNIAQQHGSHVTAPQIAEATDTDAKLVERMMRLVTYVRYAEEVTHATYTANETTMAIVTKGYVAAEKHFNDLLWPVCAKVVPLIREKGLKQFPDRSKGEVSPFEYAYGMELFEFMRSDAEQKDAFDDYMGMRRVGMQGEWFETYPAATELVPEKLKSSESEVLLVDMGGGKGHEISKFNDRFPDLPGRLVLQDLPETIRGIEKVPTGIEAIGHDFFHLQPVKGARIYYFRAVMHDWPDNDCRRILRRTIDAMNPEYSQILIDEFVMPETGADQRSASLDVLMMLYVSGTERSLPHWQELLESVGLVIVRVWEPKGRRESVIECKVKST